MSTAVSANALEDLLNALAAELEAAACEPLPPDADGSDALMYATLATGQPGIALGLMSLGDALGRDYTGAVRAAIAGSAGVVARFPLRLSLHNGVAGIAWVLEQYRRRQGDDPEVSDSLDAFDAVVVDHLEARQPWSADFDLMNGLVGFGVYALERLPRAASAAALERIVMTLADIADRRDGGVAFLTSADLLPEHTRADSPAGMYDFGLAHGQAGVLSFLASVRAARVCVDAVDALIEPLATWLIGQARTGTRSAYPRALLPDGRRIEGRFAWCRGDLGIGIALLRAARVCGRGDWEDAAVALLARAAERTIDDSAIFDACLCHGSLGLFVMFRRAFAMTGDLRLRAAASRWLETTWTFRRHDTPSGFRFGSKSMPQSLLGGCGFLMGSSGAALALTTLRNVRADWQRLLLIDDEHGTA